MPRPWLRRLIWGVAVLAGVLVIANGIVWFMYRERVLPNYSLGSLDVGNVRFDELDARINGSALVPATVELRKGELAQEIATEALGLQVDMDASKEKLRESRNFFPLLALVMHHTVPVSLEVHHHAYMQALSELAKQFKRDPLPERIVFEGEAFAIAKPEEGYKLDEDRLKLRLLGAVRRDKQQIEVPTTAIEPPEDTADLTPALDALNTQLSAKITFVNGDQTAQVSVEDKGAWYVPDGQTMQPSAEKIAAYAVQVADKFGFASYNISDAAFAAEYALQSGQEVTFVLARDGAPRAYTYCTALKNVDASHAATFERKVAAVLGDPRGWSAGGQAPFKRADNGCDFTIWLSAPNQMTSFGGLCDPVWSCRSGRNVVINFDRWQGATDAWNNASGNLEDYRVMVTNHEVGHWLGFGHTGCPGPGQPAPVMMQQSIDLKGCAFNPWPTAAELGILTS